jgi:hypothetical protein
MLSERKSRFAGKKIIIYLTIASLLNLVGCYYQQQMNPEEYNFDEKLDLQVTTNDTTYSVLSDDYYYANDTLHIKVLKPLNERTNIKVKVNIPKTEIEKVEVTRNDVTASSLTLIGVIVGILVIIGIAGYTAHGTSG